MGKIAFVFPGQGAQYPGMGRSLYESSPAAKEVFDRAEKVMPGIAGMCFSGSEEDLKQTKNTQPCLYCVSCAAAKALEAAGVRCDMTAGFSLGELSALACSGAVGFEEGLRLVSKRGELMQQAAERNPGAMCAVLALEAAAVEALCRQFKRVYPVNYNCPGQITVAGDAEELDGFRAAVKAAGGRAVPLKVGGGFHSPFMTAAAEAFAWELKGFSFSPSAVPVYSNYTGGPYGDNYAELLYKQIANPVLWQKAVENMVAAGADTFVEAGAGKVLTGLIGKISGAVRLLNAEDEQSLEKTAKEVLGDA